MTARFLLTALVLVAIGAAVSTEGVWMFAAPVIGGLALWVIWEDVIKSRARVQPQESRDSDTPGG